MAYIILKCKDCKDRHPACHDTCEHYLAWKKQEAEAKKNAMSGKFGYSDPAKKWQ